MNTAVNSQFANSSYNSFQFRGSCKNPSTIHSANFNDFLLRDNNMYNVLRRSGGRRSVGRTAAPRGRGLLPAIQGKDSWASVVGKLPQRGNSKPNNNSRTLLRSSTVVNVLIELMLILETHYYVGGHRGL